MKVWGRLGSLALMGNKSELKTTGDWLCIPTVDKSQMKEKI